MSISGSQNHRAGDFLYVISAPGRTLTRRAHLYGAFAAPIEHAQKDIHYRPCHTDGCKFQPAGKPSDRRGVYGIVELLKNIFHDQRRCQLHKPRRQRSLCQILRFPQKDLPAVRLGQYTSFPLLRKAKLFQCFLAGPSMVVSFVSPQKKLDKSMKSI
ncbi:hypothetical protein [Dysosmobacter sp.]